MSDRDGMPYLDARFHLLSNPTSQTVATGCGERSQPDPHYAKYVVRIRARSAGTSATQFNINLDVGHSGASGRYEYLREIVFDYACAMTEEG